MITTRQRVDIFGRLPTKRWHWCFLYACCPFYVLPAISLVCHAALIIAVRIELGHWPSGGLDAYTFDDYAWASLAGLPLFLAIFTLPFAIPGTMAYFSILDPIWKRPHNRTFIWHTIGLIVYWISSIGLICYMNTDAYGCYWYWATD